MITLMALDLDRLLAFTSFTHDIRNVKRTMWVKDDEQYENDSEHSFQLALIALYLIEHDHLTLDPYKTIGIALVHDILEVYAGDTFAYGEDVATQPERERQAIVLLKQRWPDQKTILSLVDGYEARSSSEAKFVYALDKLIPILNNVLDNGRNWQREHITLSRLIEVKTQKISTDPEVQGYYNLVLDLLQKKPELFVASA